MPDEPKGFVERTLKKHKYRVSFGAAKGGVMRVNGPITFHKDL